MARMRTLPKAVEELKQKDPGSCVSIYTLRHWVKTGMVPSVKAGHYFLVDLDELEAYVAGGDSN